MEEKKEEKHEENLVEEEKKEKKEEKHEENPKPKPKITKKYARKRDRSLLGALSWVKKRLFQVERSYAASVPYRLPIMSTLTTRTRFLGASMAMPKEAFPAKFS